MDFYIWRIRFKAQQINTQADADEWLASLAPEDTSGVGMAFENISVEVTEERARLSYDMVTEESTYRARMDTELGGWFVAQHGIETINLFTENDESFIRRFEPQP